MLALPGILYLSGRRKKEVAMNSCELVAYVSSLACMISKCSSREEMEVMSAVLIQLGETLHMMLVHEENCTRRKCPGEDGGMTEEG